MNESHISTIVTFTISDDSSRNDIINILEKLGYTDGNDQSTMVNARYCPTTTLKKINEYCQTVEHNLDDLDTISIYYPTYKKDKNGRIIPFIVKKDYCYDSDDDAFI